MTLCLPGSLLCFPPSPSWSKGLLLGHGVQPAAVKLVIPDGVAQVLPFILAGVVAQGMTGGGVRAVGVAHLVQ